MWLGTRSHITSGPSTKIYFTQSYNPRLLNLKKNLKTLDLSDTNTHRVVCHVYDMIQNCYYRCHIQAASLAEHTHTIHTRLSIAMASELWQVSIVDAIC